MRDYKVSVSYDSDEVEILIDGTPHVHFYKKYYRGFQAYHELKYTVFIRFECGASLKLEYDDRDLWLSIATHLREAL